MFRRISLGKARNCSRAFSLISIRYRIADILLVHSCADKLGYAKQPSSLFRLTRNDHRLQSRAHSRHYLQPEFTERDLFAKNQVPKEMKRRLFQQSPRAKQRVFIGLVVCVFGAMLPLTTLAGRKSGAAVLPANAVHQLKAQLGQFKQFPGTTSFRIDIGDHTLISDSASTQLFVASAIKTFIVCQYLRDVEEGRLSEDEQL